MEAENCTICCQKVGDSWKLMYNFQPEPEGLVTRSAADVSPSPRLISQAENQFSIPLPFFSIQAFKGWDDAHPHWNRLICSIQSTNSKTDPLPEASSQTYSEIMSNQIFGHPRTQSRWPRKVTIKRLGQILPSQPLAETNPADTLTLDI